MVLINLIINIWVVLFMLVQGKYYRVGKDLGKKIVKMIKGKVYFLFKDRLKD